MNFKFTKAKTITSIILGLILAVIGRLTLPILKSSCLEDVCVEYPFIIPLLIYFVILVIFIYVLWSLFQKKVIV